MSDTEDTAPEEEQRPEGEEEEAGEEEHGEEEAVADVPLTVELAGECLSLLCKTGDGLAHAYVRLDVHEKELTNIAVLQNFIHLRYVDISKNSIKDISCLNHLSHLLSLKADNNLLTSAKLDQLPYLQQASFSYNKIVATEGVNHPLLEQLTLNFNQVASISGLQPAVLSRLHTLELRGNKLTTTAGLNLPNLKNLFLAQNLITKLEDLDKLTQLATLHLRENQLQSLDGFSSQNAQLQYVNLRSNAIQSTKELDKLKSLPLLRAIVVSENPCAEEDDYRLEALVQLRRLERLDKEQYTEEERHEAEEIAEQRRIEEAKKQSEAQDVVLDVDEPTAG